MTAKKQTGAYIPYARSRLTGPPRVAMLLREFYFERRGYGLAAAHPLKAFELAERPFESRFEAFLISQQAALSQRLDPYFASQMASPLKSKS